MSRRTVTVSSNIANSGNTQIEDRLKAYNCHCGEYVLILDDKLEKLAKRNTDHAAVLPVGRTFKLNVKYDQDPVHLKRAGGYEVQYRMRCKRCDLWVAYEPSASGSQYTFIVDGALVEQETRY